jgi:hypothetical protein
MIQRVLTAAVALLAAAASSAQAPARAVPGAPAIPAMPAAVDYADPANWLCLPGRDDACARPLPTASLNPDDYGPVVLVGPAADPKIDCFYVYPTVSRDPGDNSDMIPGLEETGAAWVQFARFGTVCRTFAPLYRQSTIALLDKAMRGGGVAALGPAYAIAYRDVEAAWRHYLDHDNKGRPFVLIGHSQGSILLSRLIAEDIENSPAASRMLSAVLAGAVVEVPQGKLIGGTFKRFPLCGRVGETGCILNWSSFRAESPPGQGSLFGRARTPAMTAACTNPAGLASGEAPLDSIWYAPRNGSASGPVAWSAAGPPPAPFLATRGLISARCVHDGSAGYLAIRVNADPGDKRTDRIPGDVVVMGAPLPGWGLHLVDMNVAMTDVIALIAAQRDAWLRAH